MCSRTVAANVVRPECFVDKHLASIHRVRNRRDDFVDHDFLSVFRTGPGTISPYGSSIPTMILPFGDERCCNFSASWPVEFYKYQSLPLPQQKLSALHRQRQRGSD